MKLCTMGESDVQQRLDLITDFLDKMELNKKVRVKTDQVPFIQEYMRIRKWDGGLHFTSCKEFIYKTTTPE